MASPTSLSLISAAGNRFALHDGWSAGPLEDPGALALVLAGRDGIAVDGLLQLLPALDDGDCRMVIHNLDGSRSEACGNGLRCLAKVAVECGYVEGTEFAIETDAGTRDVRVFYQNDRLSHVRTSMGVPRVVDRAVPLEVREGRLEGVAIDLGNPHCVLFVPEIDEAPVSEVGEQLEVHPAFPDRVNVEFVDVRRDALHVRTWERGVGETRACGTGATAAAVAAILQERARSPVRVVMRGGELVVTWEGGEALLEGPVADVEGELEVASLL